MKISPAAQRILAANAEYQKRLEEYSKACQDHSSDDEYLDSLRCDLEDYEMEAEHQASDREDARWLGRQIV